VNSTYHVPILLDDQKLTELLSATLALQKIDIPPAYVKKGKNLWLEWKTLTLAQDRLFDKVTIALVGKYTDLHDSYLSTVKSLEHAAMHCGRKLQLVWVGAEALEHATNISDPAKFHKAWHDVCTADGILIPGGFGSRGTEGMVAAARWARTKNVPYLGVCLGMQIAVVEYARNVCHMKDAHSVEISAETPEPVIIFMPEGSKTHLGGTMRLGLRPTIFQPHSEWSKIRQLYGEVGEILERHRHRYEVNPVYIERLEKAGLNFVGKDDKGERMEIIELKEHPYYIGVQFHPEYKSRVLSPSKPYVGFVAASAGTLNKFLKVSNDAPALTNGVSSPTVEALAELAI